MAEADPLKRVKSAARRAAGPVSVDIQKRWYRDDLHQDLGLDANGKARRAGLVPRSKWFSTTRVFSFFLLSALMSAIAFTVHLARDGRLNDLFAGPSTPRPDVSWMGGIKERAASVGDAISSATSEASSPPNFFEPEPASTSEAAKVNPSETTAEEEETSSEDSADNENSSGTDPS
jgi:hypothetical protein